MERIHKFPSTSNIKQMMVERLLSAFLTKVEMHFALSKKEVGHIKALKLRGFFNLNANINKRLTLQSVGISKNVVSLQETTTKSRKIETGGFII